MIIKKVNFNLIPIVIIICTLIGCDKERGEYIEIDKEPIKGLLFNVKKEITIPEYFYEDENGNQYKIKSSKQAINFDTTNKNPLIKWDTIDSPMTIVAIANDSLTVKNNNIVNINSIMWIWHNGMKKGKNGQVYFAEGCNVEKGCIKYNESIIDTLKIDNTYYLYIWGFDYYGKNIKYASKTKKLFILR